MPIVPATRPCPSPCPSSPFAGLAVHARVCTPAPTRTHLYKRILAQRHIPTRMPLCTSPARAFFQASRCAIAPLRRCPVPRATALARRAQPNSPATNCTTRPSIRMRPRQPRQRKAAARPDPACCSHLHQEARRDLDLQQLLHARRGQVLARLTEAMQQEARSAAQRAHPGIVQQHRVGDGQVRPDLRQRARVRATPLAPRRRWPPPRRRAAARAIRGAYPRTRKRATKKSLAGGLKF